jgi:cullin 3
VLSLIQIERDGYVINRSAVKECVDVLLQLSVEHDGRTVYKRDLEPAVLKASEIFYSAEGKRLLETCDAPSYLRRVRILFTQIFQAFMIWQVEARFESEEARTHHYLYSQTGVPLREILERDLLTQNLSTVISMPNSGLDVMVDLDKLEDLNRLYRLFIMVPNGMPTLRRSFKDSILRRGREINLASSSADAGQDADDGDLNEVETMKGKAKSQGRGATGPPMLALALTWVQHVLDIKDKFDCIWERAFESNRELESSLNEVGAVFCSPRTS